VEVEWVRVGGDWKLGGHMAAPTHLLAAPFGFVIAFGTHKVGSILFSWLLALARLVFSK